MTPRADAPIKSIVCVSYKPSGYSNLEATVGICVFTGSEQSVLDKNYHDLLIRRVEDFHKKFYPLIENKAVTALDDRGK